MVQQVRIVSWVNIGGPLTSPTVKRCTTPQHAYQQITYDCCRR
jgi:hypothetical protein